MFLGKERWGGSKRDARIAHSPCIMRSKKGDGGGLKIFLSKCPNLFVFGNEVLNF